jgi:hypothetical protein
MKVGWDIVDWRLLRRVHRLRREHLLVMMITLGLTVFVDLVTAVAIGLIAADIKDHEVVIIDFSEATYLDDSAAMVIG